VEPFLVETLEGTGARKIASSIKEANMNQLVAKLKAKWGSVLSKAGVSDPEINRFLIEVARMMRD
jgi:hypothetical protein